MAGLLATALLRTQDDERLAALASAGHAGAFDVLVSRHERALRALARRLVGRDAAEDVTQQALLRAWTAMQRGVEVHQPRGWLHRIVRTTAIDHGQQMSHDTALPEDTPALADLPADVQRRMDVRHALALIAALPDEQRAAVLAAVQGRTSADVADELGVSEGAVRQLAYRARSGLRAAMTAVTPYPLAVWAAQRMAGEGAAVAAEAVGAGGSVLGGALLAKAGAVVVASGVVVAGVAVPDTPTGAPARGGAPAAGEVAQAAPPAAPPTRFAALTPGAGVVLTGATTRTAGDEASSPGERRRGARGGSRDDRRRDGDDRREHRGGERPAVPGLGEDRSSEDHGRDGRGRRDDDRRGTPTGGRGDGGRDRDHSRATTEAGEESGRDRADREGREQRPVAQAPEAEDGGAKGGGGEGDDGGRPGREEQPAAAEEAPAAEPGDDHGDSSGAEPEPEN